MSSKRKYKNCFASKVTDATKCLPTTTCQTPCSSIIFFLSLSDVVTGILRSASLSRVVFSLVHVSLSYFESVKEVKVSRG